MSIEAIKNQSPKMIAVEAATLALMALKLKQKYDRRGEKPGGREPQPYPMVEYDQEGEIYIYPPDSEGGFMVGGSHSQAGRVEVSAFTHGIDEEGNERVGLNEEELSSDPAKLTFLRDSWQEILRRWEEKTNSSA